MGNKKTNSELKERMLQICAELGLSANKLSEDSGMSREYIRQMKDYISPEMLRYISRTYPHINLIWLITGDGDIVNKANGEDVSLLIRMLNEEREKNKYLSDKVSQLEEELKKLSPECICKSFVLRILYIVIRDNIGTKRYYKLHNKL